MIRISCGFSNRFNNTFSSGYSIWLKVNLYLTNTIACTHTHCTQYDTLYVRIKIKWFESKCIQKLGKLINIGTQHFPLCSFIRYLILFSCFAQSVTLSLSVIFAHWHWRNRQISPSHFTMIITDTQYSGGKIWSFHLHSSQFANRHF